MELLETAVVEEVIVGDSYDAALVEGFDFVVVTLVDLLVGHGVLGVAREATMPYVAARGECDDCEATRKFVADTLVACPATKSIDHDAVLTAFDELFDLSDDFFEHAVTGRVKAELFTDLTLVFECVFEPRSFDVVCNDVGKADFGDTEFSKIMGDC